MKIISFLIFFTSCFQTHQEDAVSLRPVKQNYNFDQKKDGSCAGEEKKNTFQVKEESSKGKKSGCSIQ